MDPARELLQQFCQDLGQIRVQAGGPSLRDLGERLGVSKSQLAAILSGQVRRPPDWDLVKALVEIVRGHATDRGRLSQVSLPTGVDEFWRPRYAAVEHAFSRRVVHRYREARAGAAPVPQPRSPAASHQPSPAVPHQLPPVVPHQLPPAVPHFSGRSAELAALHALVEREVVAGCAVISAIGGMAGVGKTTLAVYWAHQIAGRFPDGQLYADLRGYDPADPPVSAQRVTSDFLIALGVPQAQIPAGAAARTGLYRSLLYGRRVLVVLDNARNVEQVRPLLPASPGCLVLVTARSRLTGLVRAEGARPLLLDVLADDEAAELLAHRLGRHRVDAQPRAVRDLVGLCGRLPLTLSIVAARALAHPGVSLGTLAAQLAAIRRHAGLDTFAGDDPTAGPRAVFSWSYRTLSRPAAHLFRLLGLHPGPDICVPAAASLVARPPVRARALLAELADAGLLTEHRPGRYTVHDLIRAYATDLTRDTDSPDDRHAALTRMYDHYVHTAYAAAAVLDPHDDPIPVPLTPPASGVTAEYLADENDAAAWLGDRQPVLRALQHTVTSVDFAAHCWQLAWSQDTYLFRSGHRHDRLLAWQAALHSAERLDNPAALALAHRRVANASIRLDRPADAITHNQYAIALYRRTGDHAGLAATHYNLTHLYEQLGDHHQALEYARLALDLYRTAGHRRGQAIAHNAAGWYRCLIGDYTAGLASCRHALELFREMDDQHGQASTWDSLGYAQHGLGRHAEALDSYHTALRLFRRLADRPGQVTVLNHLDHALRAQGERAAARAALDEATAILTELAHPGTPQVTARVMALDT